MPGATRQALSYYGYAWVAVRLAGGSAGIPALQHELAGLASSIAQRERRITGNDIAGLSFNIQRYDTVRAQVRASIRPQVTALAIFGGIASLAMLVLVGQGLTQLTSRSAPDTAVLRMLGATRAQAAVAAGLPGLLALAGGGALTVAGAVALSPLAPRAGLGGHRLADDADPADRHRRRAAAGIAAGRWTWQAFAGSIGAVPVTEIPLLALILGLAALAVAGNLLTAVPAAIAARTRPAVFLRAP